MESMESMESMRNTSTSGHSDQTSRGKSPPPHFHAKGKYKDILISIYGEDHSHIDNSIYEKFDKEGHLENKLIMVEHSTMYCGFKDDNEIEPYLTTYRNHYRHFPKGSEYIWFTQVLQGNPIVCIDNRLENKFLDRASEIALFNDDVNLEQVLITVKTIFAALRQIKDKFKPIEALYKQLTDTCMTQVKILIKEEKEDKTIDLKVKESLLNNLFKLSSLSVDMNIIELIEKYSKDEGPKKPIIIFAGIAHAMRIQELLHLDIESSNNLTLYENSKLNHVYTGGKKHILSKTRRKNNTKTKANKGNTIHKNKIRKRSMTTS